MSKPEISPMRLFVAMVLAALILFGFTFIPHFDESVKETRRYAHSFPGFAVLLGIALLLAGVSKSIFVDL